MLRMLREPANSSLWQGSPVKISFVKAVSIDDQPAHHGMKWFNQRFNAAPLPGQTGKSPSCAGVHDVNLLLRRAGNEMRKTFTFFPGTESIAKDQRHACAFVGKALLFDGDFTQALDKFPLIVFFQGGVVAVKKGTPRVF